MTTCASLTAGTRANGRNGNLDHATTTDPNPSKARKPESGAHSIEA
jgi:hypothetical protein